MNILFIANCTTLYGANRSMLEMAEELQKSGNQIFFLFPGRGEVLKCVRERKYKYKILDYQPSVQKITEKCMSKSISALLHNLSLLKELKSLLIQWKIDIIHTNSITHDIGMLLSLRMGIPHVWHVREMLEDDYGLEFNYKILQKILFCKSNQIIYISEAVKQKHHFQKRLRGAVVYDPIDCNQYLQKKEKIFEEEHLRLLLCGAIVEGKGHIDAIKAVNYIVKKKGKLLHLQIVGSGSRSYMAELKSYVQKNQLEDIVEFLPFQKDLTKLRKKNDIALICSKNEALGRVTIESMLSELLVIGTKSGATPELLGYGKRGYLYSVGNYKELAEKLLYVMKNKEQQKEKIHYAREYAKQTFEVKSRTKDILRIYQSVLK